MCGCMLVTADYLGQMAAADYPDELELLFQGSPCKHDDHLVFAHPATGNPIDRSKLLMGIRWAPQQRVAAETK